MSKYNISIVSEKHPEHLKPTWRGNKNVRAAVHPSGDPEYPKIFAEHFSEFSGSILEVGAGDGFLAHHILSTYPDVEYTILDIKFNIETVLKKRLEEFPNVTFVNSADYEEVFKNTYDLFIETHCLSETPRYYYTRLLENLSAKSCLVIDYAGDPNDPGFEETLENWFKQYTSGEKHTNMNLAGAKKMGGIPVYIGKKE